MKYRLTECKPTYGHVFVPLTSDFLSMLHSKCLYSNVLPKQVIIWEEKPTGLEGCTSTPLSLSGLAVEGLEIFSERISSLMLEISAISTMVRLNRMKNPSSLHIKVKRRVVLCLFIQKHFVYCIYFGGCQKPAAFNLHIWQIASSLFSSLYNSQHNL